MSSFMVRRFRKGFKHRKAPKSRRTGPGAVPGTLAVDPQARRTRIRCLAYDADRFIEKEDVKPQEIPKLLEAWPVTWIDVDGLRNADTLQSLGELLELHALALEDVVNEVQRPKVDAYSNQVFVIARMVSVEEHLVTEQLSLALGNRFVVTFQGQRPGDCLDPVRTRIRNGRGFIRSRKADYLAYAIVDAVVDHYFPVLDLYTDRIEALEHEAFADPQPTTPERIQAAKSDLYTLRRVIFPLRDAVSTLERDEIGVFAAETRIYLRDCHDHTNQLMDLLDAHRETISGLLDVYLSSISVRMNDVMKVLTIIATIFIPLTFVVGVYGMNFDTEVSPWNMPELHYRYGYPAVLLFMALIALWLVYFFWRKGWIGRKK